MLSNLKDQKYKTELKITKRNTKREGTDFLLGIYKLGRVGSPSILQKLSYVNTQKLDLTNQLGKSQKDTKRYKSRDRERKSEQERERERERGRESKIRFYERESNH